MDGFPLREAFRRMLRTAQPADVGLTKQALYHHRQRLLRGEYPQEETMRDLLRAAGWMKVVEERWKK